MFIYYIYYLLYFFDNLNDFDDFGILIKGNFRDKTQFSLDKNLLRALCYSFAVETGKDSYHHNMVSKLSYLSN